jgi:hypothetical protein
MIRKELKAVKSLRLSNGVRIVYGDRGNCIVLLDESEYQDKLNILLKSGVYDPLPKVERKVQKLLARHKTLLPADLNHKLTAYHS